MTSPLHQFVLKVIAMVIAITSMTICAHSQETAITPDEMLGCLHEGLKLGIDLAQLKQIAPQADNTPSPGRVAVPGVYVEMRDLDGKPLAFADRKGKTFWSDLSIGEATYYHFDNKQLVRIERLIRIDPLGNIIDHELVKKIHNLLRTAEMKMSLFGALRYPTLQITYDDQTMLVRFRNSGRPSLSGGADMVIEIDVFKTKLASNNQLVELSGREDHESFAEFGTVFEEIKSP